MSFIPIFRFLSISTFFSGPFDLTLSSYCVKDGKGKISLPKSARLSFMVSMESFIFFLVYEEYRIEAKKRIRLCLLEKAAGKTLPVVLRNAERESTRAVAVKFFFVCFFCPVCLCVGVWAWVCECVIVMDDAVRFCAVIFVFRCGWLMDRLSPPFFAAVSGRRWNAQEPLLHLFDYFLCSLLTRTILVV